MTDLNYLYMGNLVEKAKQNSSDAFAELYALTYKRQYNYACHYLKDPYLAQDAVQDVYIHVLKHIHDMKDPLLFIAWLNQITFHTCFDICKKKDRHYGEINPLALDLERDIYTEHNPEEITEKKDETIRLQKAINKLPPTEQQAIILKYFNSMTLEEIVLATGVSRSTVKRQLASGKEKLGKILR